LCPPTRDVAVALDSGGLLAEEADEDLLRDARLGLFD
jgi:hypothetical protein